MAFQGCRRASGRRLRLSRRTPHPIPSRQSKPRTQDRSVFGPKANNGWGRFHVFKLRLRLPEFDCEYASAAPTEMGPIPVQRLRNPPEQPVRRKCVNAHTVRHEHMLPRFVERNTVDLDRRGDSAEPFRSTWINDVHGISRHNHDRICRWPSQHLHVPSARAFKNPRPLCRLPAARCRDADVYVVGGLIRCKREAVLPHFNSPGASALYSRARTACKKPSS